MLSGLNQKPYDIFISYHKAQSNEVLKFYRSIRNMGSKCWFDQYSNNRRSGQSIYDDSITGIRNSRLFLFFESPEYKKTLRYRVELAIALEQRMPIVNLALFNFPQEDDINSTTTSTPDESIQQPLPSSIISDAKLRNFTFEELESYDPNRYLKFDIDDSSINELFSKQNEHKLNEILNRIHELLNS